NRSRQMNQPYLARREVCLRSDDRRRPFPKERGKSMWSSQPQVHLMPSCGKQRVSNCTLLAAFFKSATLLSNRVPHLSGRVLTASCPKGGDARSFVRYLKSRHSYAPPRLHIVSQLAASALTTLAILASESRFCRDGCHKFDCLTRWRGNCW